MSRTAATLLHTCGQRLLAALLALFVLLTLLFASAPAHAQSNNAAFVSQNVPGTMIAGQRYSVSVTMKNTGTSTWSAANGYGLGLHNPRDGTPWGTSRAALTASVAPGVQHTFTYNVTAPATPGTYNFQWKMLWEGIEWFGDSAPNLAVNVTAPPLVNDNWYVSQFISQSVPTAMTSGQTYSVSVTMKNMGAATWSAANNYKLGAQNPQDNTTWGISRVELTASVAPGAQHTFSFNVTAPTTLGTNNFQWGMVREGIGWFGANTTNTAVNVTPSANQPTLSVQRTPTPLVAGQNHTVNWSSTKATSVTYTCTASGTGFTGSATLATSGSTTHATSAAWIGYPSTCTWRATGAGGSTTVTETMTTVAAPAVDSVTYFHNDIAGTAQLATNASGVVVWKENYLPYGQRQAQAPASAGNRLWYTGKPHEEDTGLTYMGARYYMPLVGRFTGMDPVDIVPEQPHSLNRYAYGNNNPYKYVDPDGRFPALLIPLIWSVAGAATSGAVNATAQQMATGHVQWGGVGGVLDAAGDGMLLGPVFGAAAARGSGVAANGVKETANPVPLTMARVIPNGTPATTLGRPGVGDVFVTGASDIAGMNSKQIAQRLTIPESPTGFRVIEFATPKSGVASPVFRSDPGFVGGGRTAGGAREFVIPNGPIPSDAIIRTAP